MDIGFGSMTQAPSTARALQQPVATALICPNILLNAGISSILSGTAFTVMSSAAPSASHECLQSDPKIDLYLICESPTPDGYSETVDMLKAQCPAARIVVLADHMEPTALARALQTGLNGFCLTAMPRETLLKALELVILGETFIPASMYFTIIGAAFHREHSMRGAPAALIPANDFAGVAPSNKFSTREAQILHYLTQGASNKLIARELGLAEATVKVHIKSILRKTKAANRSQAAMWASEQMKPA
jgi:two-component system, NarL family, nitrate/nitrite response regulator NarL